MTGVTGEGTVCKIPVALIRDTVNYRREKSRGPTRKRKSW